LEIKFLLLSIAPFGLPVVPEVYMSIAQSSSEETLCSVLVSLLSAFSKVMPSNASSFPSQIIF